MRASISSRDTLQKKISARTFGVEGGKGSRHIHDGKQEREEEGRVTASGPWS